MGSSPPNRISGWISLIASATPGAGTTRVKTRLAEVLISQDIRRGEVVIVFDPKGDIDLPCVASIPKPGGRDGKGVLHVPSWAPGTVGAITLCRKLLAHHRGGDQIAGQLPSEGSRPHSKEFVWRFVNVMAKALVALGRKPDYEQINYASNVEPLLNDYFEHWLDQEPAAAGWRAEVESMAIDKKSPDKGLAVTRVSAVTLSSTCDARNSTTRSATRSLRP